MHPFIHSCRSQIKAICGIEFDEVTLGLLKGIAPNLLDIRNDSNNLDNMQVTICLNEPSTQDEGKKKKKRKNEFRVLKVSTTLA